MVRRLRYSVAMSLDGFIADPEGGYDWIVHDPTIDFAAIFQQYDTLVMGRKTYEVMKKQGQDSMPGVRLVVLSRTLRPDNHPTVTIVNEDGPAFIADLKQRAGKDIWLFGGGELFRTIFDAGLVDEVEVAVIPVLLGAGVPVIAPGQRSKPLRLLGTKTYPSGIVALTYDSTGR